MRLSIHRFQEKGFSLQSVQTLLQAYLAYYQAQGIELGFQGFEAELLQLPGKFHPEVGGQLYLAKWHGHSVGCVAFYRMNAIACELKRLRHLTI